MAIKMAFAPVLMVCVLLLACGARPKTHHTQVGWRPIGSWSGRGDSQTDSFNIESTQWRNRWETRGGTAHFTLVVHSAVSGRPIQDAVQQQGNGRGIVYVTEDPRLYHLVIDSDGVDWSIKVEEAVVGDVP